MNLVLVSFSHHNAPFELLGRIALSEPYVPAVLQRLAAEDPIHEVVCLSTCNRTDFYCVTDSPSAARRLVLEALADTRRVRVDDLSEHALVLEEMEARRHLLATASGIASLIVGELEILGQVRRAWETAESAGTGGRLLGDLFQRALQVGRRARQLTNISRGNLSVASAALTMIRAQLPDLKSCRALVIGTGEVGQKILNLLNESGVSAMMLVNRTAQKAETLAQQMGCTPVPMERMVEAVAEADIVMCATGAPHYVVTGEMVRRVGAGATGCRVFVDLSAPPNIDPAVAGIPGNALLTIADLQGIADENAALRQEEVRSVVTMIDREVARMERVQGARPHEEIVREFRIAVESIRAQHLETFGRRFDEQTRTEVDKYSRSLVSALLHGIMNNMRDLSTDSPEAERDLEVARRLLLQPAADKTSTVE